MELVALGSGPRCEASFQFRQSRKVQMTQGFLVETESHTADGQDCRTEGGFWLGRKKQTLRVGMAMELAAAATGGRWKSSIRC